MTMTNEEKLGSAPLFRLMMSMGIPTLVAQIINLLYNIIDRIYIGHIPEVGATALTGVGLALPMIVIISAFSAFVGAGGAPLSAIALGRGKKEEAERILGNGFSLLLVFSAFLMILFFIIKRPVLFLIGASDATFPFADEYMTIYIFGTLFVQISLGMNPYITAQGCSRTAMLSVLIGAVLNIALDPLFIFGLSMGIRGAAIATGLGYSVTAVAGLAVFSRKKNLLHFEKPVFRFQVLKSAAANGCSEMATALVTGIITMMFNWTMLHYVGEDGVAAVTIIMYVLMFASSLYTGYSYGVAPMISYYYGEQNHEKLKKLVAASMRVIAEISLVTVAASFLLTKPLVSVFARPDNPVYGLAVTGNRICTIALLFIGFNIFASGMFTALSNGMVSAVLAFSRSFVFMLVTMVVLPLILGVNGIWLATPAAELMALALSAVMFLKYRKRYGY